VRAYSVHGDEIPEIDDEVIGEIEGHPGVAWAQRGYGDVWLWVSADTRTKLNPKDLIAYIRVRVRPLGVRVKQFRPEGL